MTPPSTTLLRATAFVEAALTLAGVLAVLAKAGVTRRRRKRYGPFISAAKHAMAIALTHEDASGTAAEAEALVALQELPPDLQLDLFVEFGRTLTGTQRIYLTNIAARLNLAPAAYRLTRKLHWGARVRGVRFLALFGGGEEEVRTLLADSHPVIRAQAAMAAGDSAEMVNWLTVLLNDPSGLCRFAAQNALLRVGEPATASIQPLLDPRRREVYAALPVAIHLASLDFIEPALRLSQHASHRLRAPAATLLGKLGGPKATQRLLELLEDSAPEVRMATVHALADLAHWPASSQIALRLRDIDWKVRREAGFALLRLGSPGRLLLQRYTRDGDRYAASMATHVLDVARFAAEVYA